MWIRRSVSICSKNQTFIYCTVLSSKFSMFSVFLQIIRVLSTLSLLQQRTWVVLKQLIQRSRKDPPAWAFHLYMLHTRACGSILLWIYIYHVAWVWLCAPNLDPLCQIQLKYMNHYNSTEHVFLFWKKVFYGCIKTLTAI